MNYQNQSKQMVIDAMLKLVDSAPGIQLQRVAFPYQLTQRNDVSVQEFNNWLDYVISIFDITFNYTELNNIILAKMRILQISSQNEMSYVQRISQINHEILGLARSLI